MNILHLDLGPEIRGGQRQVHYILNYFSHIPDINSCLGCLEGSPLRHSKADSSGPLLFPSRQEFDPRNWIRLRSFLRQNKIDIIHTHEPRAASLAALFKAASLFSGSLIHTRRVSYPLRNAWSRKKYSLADALVCVSQEVRGVMLGLDFPDSRIWTIPSAIDVKKYSVAAEGKSDCLRLGIIGALTPQKGHEFLLDALAYLTDIDFYLYVVGEGRLFAHLISRTRELGLENRVEFCGYVQSQKIIPQLDVVVVPSMDGEGSNAVIKEAWACRVPVFVSDLASNVELVRHEKDGLVFSRHEPESLAQMIRSAHEDYAVPAALAENGYARVGDFDVPKMGRAHLDMYNTLTSEK